MKACECNSSLGNLGTPGCQPLAKVAKLEFFVPTYDASGALNKLDLSVPFTQAILDGLLNNADPQSRWYPTSIIEAVTSERSESIFDEAPSGNKDFVKQGVRSESYEIRNQAGAYKTELDKARCFEVSKFVVDIDKSLTGMIIPTVNATDDGFLYPIKIDNSSFDVNMNMATDTTVAKLVISYDYAQSEDDANLRTIAGADITADLLGSKGLIDVYATYSAISAAGMTVQLNFSYGSQNNLIADSGLLLADFTLNELSPTPGAVTITSVTETGVGTGIYDFLFTATSADVLELTPVKDKRDYKYVIAKTILIP